jgi:hypothetical protein
MLVHLSTCPAVSLICHVPVGLCCLQFVHSCGQYVLISVPSKNSFDLYVVYSLDISLWPWKLLSNNISHTVVVCGTILYIHMYSICSKFIIIHVTFVHYTNIFHEESDEDITLNKSLLWSFLFKWQLGWSRISNDELFMINRFINIHFSATVCVLRKNLIFQCPVIPVMVYVFPLLVWPYAKTLAVTNK